jgi:glycosyltransferase involved in cell wall biosynthesis
VFCHDEEAMMLSIDIIIPTFDRPGRAPVLVKAIAEQLGKGDHVYVIWQGKAKPEIRESETISCVHSSPTNLPKARNKGIAEGSGDICLFLDDDVEIISTDLLEQHRKAHMRDEVGGVAGYLEDPVFAKDNPGPSKFDETTGELKQNFDIDKSQYAVSVMGAHMSFKRRVLLDIKGFDERFKANALWEEIDCAFRVRKAGWKIFYCAEAKVRHVREKSGGCRGQREQSPAYVYHQFANTAYFATRHAKPKYYRSWLRFWKYRLEFISRKKGLLLKHDPWLAGAGLLGACGGIVRYLMHGNRKMSNHLGRLLPIFSAYQDKGD